MALKMNRFQSGPRISSLVWPGVLKMFCCLAVVVGGYPPAEALSSDQAKGDIDFVPIVVIPYSDNSHPNSKNSNGQLAIHTIKCDSKSGITQDCVTTIQQTINDLQKQKRKHKLIVELYDEEQLSAQLKNLVVPAPFFVHAFYLRCIRPSPFEKEDTKCRGGTPWSYDPYLHAAGKYHQLGTRESVEFSRIDSPGSIISYRENEWQLDGVTIHYFDSKSAGDEKKFPFKDPVLSWKGNGFILRGRSSELAHASNLGKPGNVSQGYITRTARAVRMSSTKQTRFALKGKPFEYTLSFSTENLIGHLHPSKVLGPFGAEDIRAPATIYVFYLHDEAKDKYTTSKRTTKGHKIVEVDCFGGDKLKKFKDCVKKMAFDKKKDKKDDIDLYVVSSLFPRMTMFTQLLNSKYGAYRDGKLWADYVLEEPPPKSRRDFRNSGWFPAPLGVSDSSVQQFHLATLASYKAFAGGLVEFLGHLCFTFTVSYSHADWELYVDNDNMDKHFELDPGAESVSLEWSLEKITVRQMFVVRFRKLKKRKETVNEKIYAHPPLSREFRLQTRKNKSTKNKVTITWNDKKKTVDSKKTESKIEWKRLTAPIAANETMTFDFKPDFSRTWNQLESLK